MILEKNQQVFMALLRVGLFSIHGEGCIIHDRSDVNWSEVYRLAEEHGVVGLIADGIEKIQAEQGIKVPLKWMLRKFTVKAVL